MKTILLWDSRFPDRRPARLTLDDTVASAAVRAGVAAVANPAEAGALSAGGALDPSMLTEVVLQHGSVGATRRVVLPYSVVMVGALAGVLAAIGTPIASGVTPTPSPTPTPTPSPTIAFANTTASVTEGDSGTKTVSNVINVTRNGVTGPLTVNLSYGGTATSGTDYVAGPVSGTIADGQSSLSFDLTINGDTGVESDETIVINAVLAAYSSATASKTITVTNDDVTVAPSTLAISGDPSPSTTATPYSFAPETSGGSGTKAFAFTGATPPSALGGTFNTATGEITGPFTSVGTVAGNVAVSDASGTASLAVSIAVAAGPASVAGLAMALDGYELAQAYGPVRTWPSAFGASLVATSILAEAPQAGMRTVNGLPVVDFNPDINQRLSCSIPQGAGHTIFLVVYQDSYGATRNVFNGATGSLGARITATGTVQIFRTGGATLLSGTTPLVRGRANVIAIRSGSAGTTVRINGVLDQTIATDAALTSPITSIGGLTTSYNGALAALYAYGAMLSDADMATIEAFSTARWITLRSLPANVISWPNGRIVNAGSGEQFAWAA